MNNIHPALAQALAGFMPPLPATHCAIPDCCYRGQPRATSCACSDDPEAVLAAGLAAAAEDAQRAYRAQERRALDLQLNDKSGAFV